MKTLSKFLLVFLFPLLTWGQVEVIPIFVGQSGPAGPCASYSDVGELYTLTAMRYCSGSTSTMPPVGGYGGALANSNTTAAAILDPGNAQLGDYVAESTPTSVISNQSNVAYLASTASTVYDLKITAWTNDGASYDIKVFDTTSGFSDISLGNTNTTPQEFTYSHTAGGTLFGIQTRRNSAPLTSRLYFKVTAKVQ